MQSSQEEDLSKVVVKIDPVVHELKSAQVTKANDKIVTQVNYDNSKIEFLCRM